MELATDGQHVEYESPRSHQDNCRKIIGNIFSNVSRENWPCIQFLIGMEFVPYCLLVPSSEMASLKVEIISWHQSCNPASSIIKHSEASFLLQLLYLNTRSATETPFFPEQRKLASHLRRVQHGIDAATCFLILWLDTYPNLPETDVLFEEVVRCVAYHLKSAMSLLYTVSRSHIGVRRNSLPSKQEYEGLYTRLYLLIKALERAVLSHGSVKEELLKNLIQAVCPFVLSAHLIKVVNICCRLLKSVLKTNLHKIVPALETCIAEALYEQVEVKNEHKRTSRIKSTLLVHKVESFVCVLISLTQSQAKVIIELTEDKVSLEEKAQLFFHSILKFAGAIYEACFRRRPLTNDVHVVLSKLLEKLSEPEQPAAGFLVLALGDMLAQNLESQGAVAKPDEVTFAFVNLAAILESMRNVERICHQFSSDIKVFLERAMNKKDFDFRRPEVNVAVVRHTLKRLLCDHWEAEGKIKIWACLMLHRDKTEELSSCPRTEEEPLISSDKSLQEWHHCYLASIQWFVMLSSFKDRQLCWFELIASFMGSMHKAKYILALRVLGQVIPVYPEWLVHKDRIGFQRLFRDALTDSNIVIPLAAIDILSRSILHSHTDHVWKNMGDALVACLTDPRKGVKMVAVLALHKVCHENPDWPYVQTTLWEILMTLESKPSYVTVDLAIVDLFRQRWFTPVSVEMDEKEACACDVLVNRTHDIRRFMDEFEPEKHQRYLRLLFTRLFYPGKVQNTSSQDVRLVAEKFVELWTLNPHLVEDLENFLGAWAQTVPQMLEQLLYGFFAFLREHFWPILEAADKEKLLKAWENKGDLLSCILAVTSHILPGLGTPPCPMSDWLQLENLLVFYLSCEEVVVAEEFVQCWYAVVHYVTKDSTSINDLVEKYYLMANKYMNAVAIQKPNSQIREKVVTFEKTFVHTLEALGLVGLYFGFEVFDETEGIAGQFAIASPLSFRLAFFLTKFIENSYDHFNRKHYDCRLAAVHGLKTLGFMTVRYDEYLLKGFLHEFYKKHLHDEYFRTDVFYRALQNLSFQWRRPRERSVSRIGNIMKCYVAEIKESLLSPIDEIRTVAFQLVCYGLLADVSEYKDCVPYLVALSSNAELGAEQNVCIRGWEPCSPRVSLKWVRRALKMDLILSRIGDILLTTFKYQCRLQMRNIVSGVRGQNSLLEEFYVSLQCVERRCKFLKEALRVWTSHTFDLKYLNFVAGALAHLPFTRRGEVEVLTKIAQKEVKKIAWKAVHELQKRSVNLADESVDFSVCEEILRGFQASILLAELVKYLETEYYVQNGNGRAAECVFRNNTVFCPTVIINDLGSLGECNRHLFISRYRKCRKFL